MWSKLIYKFSICVLVSDEKNQIKKLYSSDKEDEAPHLKYEN